MSEAHDVGGVGERVPDTKVKDYLEVWRPSSVPDRLAELVAGRKVLTSSLSCRIAEANTGETEGFTRAIAGRFAGYGRRNSYISILNHEGKK